MLEARLVCKFGISDIMTAFKASSPPKAATVRAAQWASTQRGDRSILRSAVSRATSL